MTSSESAKKIVFIEDDTVMSEIITRKLNAHGFLVKTALDGKEGLRLVLKEKPTLVILDLLLPEMDGYQVLEKIRDNPNQEIAKTPVMILSNVWSNEDKKRAENLGIEDYLIKSQFTTEEIINKVSAITDKLKP